MYPLKFESIYLEKPWGGRGLAVYKENLPSGDIGESWELSMYGDKISVIKNGVYTGITLKQLLDMEEEKVVGTSFVGRAFPLLIKLINSKHRLSLQVHPNNRIAKAMEGQKGKDEFWYVMECEEKSTLIVGTKPCTLTQFKMALSKQDINPLLNYVKVSCGDFFYIKGGTVHGINEGLVILEIQQSSDITYRLFDYNRGRELQIDKGLKAADLSLKGGGKFNSFKIEFLQVEEEMIEHTNGRVFFTYTAVEGKIKIIYKEGEEWITKGETVLIPASLGELRLRGKGRIVKAVARS